MLQNIRHYYETPVVEICTEFSIPYRPANTLEPNGDAYSEFIDARLQFGPMMENVVGDCVKLKNIRGAFIVEYYGPKGRGPARAQHVMDALLDEMLCLKGVSDINGPNFDELAERPYYFARMSMAIITDSGSGCCLPNPELDKVYVNVDGDTMTGSLTIGSEAELKLPGEASADTVIAVVNPDGTVTSIDTLDGGTY